MPAVLMAMMLMAAGQDVSTLKVPHQAPKMDSVPWTRPGELPNPVARPPSSTWTPPRLQPEPVVACPLPAHGRLVSYDRLPEEVLVDLRTTDPRISPPGGPFNASDVDDGVTPHTRVIAAMRLGRRLAVAYEKGGRGYSISVLTYDADARTGRMTVSGVHPLIPNTSDRPWLRDADACKALEWALGA
jgi:hypothetical protein